MAVRDDSLLESRRQRRHESMTHICRVSVLSLQPMSIVFPSNADTEHLAWAKN
jgi:hypothetical protein